MNLREALSAYIGRDVEVATNSFYYEGRLLAVDDATITVQPPNGYVPPPPIEISIASINYVRVLVA
ncbi:hypothetical protein [Laceyella putida]|uniref:DUF2642 domain-containing protein n=1 Tax=Laceyella putida TaxID=110101 RepID=A0ABW2RKX8_9BACL